MSLLDTDHIWGIGGDAAWVWKAFTRGHNPLFMDPYDSVVLGSPTIGQWEDIRRAMGQTRRLADRVNLAAMTPHEELASTRYCLANPGVAYIVYLPMGGEVTVDLTGIAGTLTTEWFNPAHGYGRDRRHGARRSEARTPGAGRG